MGEELHVSKSSVKDCMVTIILEVLWATEDLSFENKKLIKQQSALVQKQYFSKLSVNR